MNAATHVCTAIAAVFLFAFAPPAKGAKPSLDPRQHSAIQGQFSECERLLGQARAASGRVPGAARYVNQAEQLLHKARNDYNQWYQSFNAPRIPGQLQTIDPFGDYLFHGVPIRPADGKLVVRTFDSNQFTARAGEWMEQMKQITGSIESMRSGNEMALAADVEKLLRQLGVNNLAAPTGIQNPPATSATLGGEAESHILDLNPKTEPAAGLPVVGLLRNPYDTDIYAPGSPIGQPSSEYDFSNLKPGDGVRKPPEEVETWSDYLLRKAEDLGKWEEDKAERMGALYGKFTASGHVDLRDDPISPFPVVPGAGLATRVIRNLVDPPPVPPFRAYDQDEVSGILKDDGFVIAVRPLALGGAEGPISKALGRENNVLDGHWQVFLPGGKSFGLMDGTMLENGKTVLQIKADDPKYSSNYYGVLVRGKDGNTMKQAVENIKSRWDTRYIQNPGQGDYSAGMRNCQDFVREALQEYRRLGGR